jgi:hypothetical protein
MVSNSNAMPAMPPNTAVASDHRFTVILEILKTAMQTAPQKQTTTEIPRSVPCPPAAREAA